MAPAGAVVKGRAAAMLGLQSVLGQWDDPFVLSNQGHGTLLTRATCDPLSWEMVMAVRKSIIRSLGYGPGIETPSWEWRVCAHKDSHAQTNRARHSHSHIHTNTRTHARTRTRARARRVPTARAHTLNPCPATNTTQI